jgi:hypothetical protein
MITWDKSFAPSYTPLEMLELGVFMDCHYTNVIKGIPKKYTNHKNTFKRGEEPDSTKNCYGVKSRQSLKVWKENDWIKTDKLGWWEWFLKYFEGRRLGEEDTWQINRWRSFVARHQGSINSTTKSKNKDAYLKEKQALLQWGWNWETKFNDEQLKKNLKRIIKITNTKIVEVSNEKIYLNW